MAESSSSALPGGVEWLPTLGGAHLLRVAVRGTPPVLVLHTKEGAEQRIEPGPQARFDGRTTYLVPAGIGWSRASLAWPDGTRAALPAQAEVIALPRRRAPAPRHPEPLPWTAPPWAGAADTEAAAAEWAARRAKLERELEAVRAARGDEASRLAAELEAIRAARGDEASRLAAELEAERAAHAQTRQSLAEALAAAREARETAGTSEELEALRAELAAARAEAEIGADARAHLSSARRDAALARAEVATLRAALEAERAARARAEAALAEAGSDTAYLERVAKLDRDVEGLRAQVRLERRAREQAEAAAAAARRPPEETGRLVANLDAAAAALRATTPPRDDAEPPAAPDLTAAVTPASPAAAAAPTVADVSPDAAVPPTAATAASPAAVAPTSAAAAPAPAGAEPRVVAASVARTSRISSSPTMYRARPALAAPDRERGLRRALAALAAEDSVAAGTLIAGLLPAQGAVIEDTLTYDLTIRGIGTFAVFVAGGDVRVQRTHRARGRGESAFHLNAEPLALAELLAGERRKVRRFGRAARYSGRRKNLRALAALPAARLSLAEAVRAGATLEPSLLYRALPYAVPAEWTRGHVFTVEQVITELAPRAWYITARDGVPLQVIEYAAGAAADATVTMSRAAFDRLLRGEAPSDGDRPTIHGDHNAVATLKRWTDLIV